MARCSICGREYEEYGHGAFPINNGQCCNLCNDTVVIPERIRRSREATKGKDTPNDGTTDTSPGKTTQGTISIGSLVRSSR